ncbi:MAG: hypothetical protein B6D55_04765 [Candidatus Omnitrophica bacterium 4484_70.2]|nr:MAG: hypothetical protein B6D55_04765 [Candidatus Omnitrophica bacterium 4484_70.2]
MRKGILQKAFAQKLRLNQKTIRRYETGITKPEGETVEKNG